MHGKPNGRGDGGAQFANGQSRGAYTFYLNADLVERARREVGERDVVRSIEAALAAALDYQVWVREVRSGRRDVLA